MKKICRGFLVGLVTVAMALAFTLPASAQNKCQSGKIKCADKKEASLLKCWKNVANEGSPIDPACLQNAYDKFDGGADPTKGCFAKLEAKGGCITSGDGDAIEAKVDAFVQDVKEELYISPPVRDLCAAGKIKCVFKKVSGINKCNEKCTKDFTKCGAVLEACIANVKGKFDGGADPAKGCFAKLEIKGNCNTTGDTAVIEAKVDAFVDDLACELDRVSGICPCAANEDECSDICVDKSIDPANCGDCGTVCSAPNGTPACSNGTCGIAGCNGGYANCNNNPADGCEINVANNTSNCGSCGHVCSAANGFSICASGTCQIGYCFGTYANCNNYQGDGCEINVANDVYNCGSCGHVCSAANGYSVCASGTCQIGYCYAGYANCNNYPADGCETNIYTNSYNCGQCGNICFLPNASSYCGGGTCQFDVCFSGYGNCNGNPYDGCEVSLMFNSNNCGYCGHVCGPFFHCSSGSCIFG